jgi:hypothetical protein
MRSTHIAGTKTGPGIHQQTMPSSVDHCRAALPDINNPHTGLAEARDLRLLQSERDNHTQQPNSRMNRQWHQYSDPTN